MPLTNTIVPTYPDVPIAPGVPFMFRASPDAGPTFVNVDQPLVNQDSPDLSPNWFTPQWGLMDSSGSPVIDADSVVGLEYQRDFRVSDYPIEQGGFASFNKVQMPRGIKLTFAKGGTEGDRADFLMQVEAAIESLDLLTVVSPETTYPNVNAIHADYRRISTRGVSLIQVDIWCEEIRPAPNTQFTSTNPQVSSSDTQSPNAASPKQGGNVQPIDAQVSALPDVNTQSSIGDKGVPEPGLNGEVTSGAVGSVTITDITPSEDNNFSGVVPGL